MHRIDPVNSLDTDNRPRRFIPMTNPVIFGGVCLFWIIIWCFDWRRGPGLRFVAGSRAVARYDGRLCNGSWRRMWRTPRPIGHLWTLDGRHL